MEGGGIRAPQSHWLWIRFLPQAAVKDGVLLQVPGYWGWLFVYVCVWGGGMERDFNDHPSEKC